THHGSVLRRALANPQYRFLPVVMDAQRHDHLPILKGRAVDENRATASARPTAVPSAPSASRDSLRGISRSPPIMEGLRPSQQEAQNDRHGRRIPTPVPAACVAARLCAHSSFQLSFSTATPTVHCHQPPSAGGGASATLPNADRHPAPTWPCPCCGGTMIIL